MTVVNVVCSILMIRLLVWDRKNLGGIIDPMYKFAGCYDTPYVYFDEGDFTTWPGVARGALFYIIYTSLVWPLLVFYHAYNYGHLLTETMRIADNPELLG